MLPRIRLPGRWAIDRYGSAVALVVVSFAVVAYALVSKRLASTPISGPMLFMALGIALGPAGAEVIHGAEDRATIASLLEIALALVLFTDALEISAGDWRAKSRLPTRLLVIGMPLTMLLGWGVGAALFPDVDVWEAALLAICLAPTDAALGQAVVSSRRVPAAIRQALNIESGLNDGLALPFFVLALGAAIQTEDVAGPGLLEAFVRSVVLAAAIGAVVGWLGARAISVSRERGWVGGRWSQIALLGLVLLAFAAADAAEGSGFIATWVAGVMFGRSMRNGTHDVSLLSEDLGALLAEVSFLGFGAVLLGPVLGDLSWQVFVYAVLSLTVIRMLPVAVSLIGAGLARPTVWFAGWFGPRGLASIVFGLLVAESALPHDSVILEAVFATVALSVILHGMTAVWGANRYGRWYERAVAERAGLAESRDVGAPEVRRRFLAHEPS
jgi:NhaP-type Na+/H+ or K+/H+ antiporter